MVSINASSTTRNLQQKNKISQNSSCQNVTIAYAQSFSLYVYIKLCSGAIYQAHLYCHVFYWAYMKSKGSWESAQMCMLIRALVDCACYKFMFYRIRYICLSQELHSFLTISRRPNPRMLNIWLNIKNNCSMKKIKNRRMSCRRNCF